MQSKKSGFTMVEMLIVVVIVSLVAVLAVPALRNSQASSKNQRAQGVLIDLGNAVKMYNTFHISANISGQILNSGFTLDITGVNCDTSSLAYAANTAAQKNACFLQSGIFRNIAWDDNGTSYAGYNFFICPATGTNGATCCSANIGTIAVMLNTEAGGRYGHNNSPTGASSGDNKQCAWITADGGFSNNYSND